ncbi:MAG: type II toxin-antitoxin system RelE/ParE family toxin [Micrococcales bacterium]|nr:type II toxin-antitoxin system RelE/ParE family toxin [Micrococcales bacterium]
MTKWRLEYDPEVVRWLRKADPPIARRIRNALVAVVGTGNPRQRGRSLTGPLAGLWRYRIGDYRVICDIQDERLVVLVIEMGPRSDIYDR